MRILFAIILAGIFAQPASSQETGGTLAKIRQAGKIVLGARDAAPPFSYLGDDQKLIGYSLDICAKVVEAIRAELKLPDLAVQLLPVNSSTRIPLMTNGTIDLECGSTTNNAARQKLVTFANSHFVTASRFVSKKAAGLDGIDDLKGKTVVSVSGSVNVAQINRVNQERKLGLTVVSVRDAVEAFLMVETDRAVAFVMDDVQLATLIAAAKEPSAYVISEAAFGPPEPYGIMLRRDDPAFKVLVNRATADLYRSPEMAAIYRRWFEEPVPPRGVNYGYPMPAAVKRAFAKPTDSPDPAAYGE